jgi:hypothetical protein
MSPGDDEDVLEELNKKLGYEVVYRLQEGLETEGEIVKDILLSDGKIPAAIEDIEDFLEEHSMKIKSKEEFREKLTHLLIRHVRLKKSADTRDHAKIEQNNNTRNYSKLKNSIESNVNRWTQNTDLVEVDDEQDRNICSLRSERIPETMDELVEIRGKKYRIFNVNFADRGKTIWMDGRGPDHADTSHSPDRGNINDNSDTYQSRNPDDTDMNHSQKNGDSPEHTNVYNDR